MCSAQNELSASIYENIFGLGQTIISAPKDDYRLAANQGVRRSRKTNLAGPFVAGHGVHRRLQAGGLDWYRKAADQNLVASRKGLIGYFYQVRVRGGKQDFAQAHCLAFRAAGHGNSDAENQLGHLAGEGWGQQQNYDEALSRYYKASEHGNAQAQENSRLHLSAWHRRLHRLRQGYVLVLTKLRARATATRKTSSGGRTNTGKACSKTMLGPWKLVPIVCRPGQYQRREEPNIVYRGSRGRWDRSQMPRRVAMMLPSDAGSAAGADIQNLRYRIDKVETDALYQDSDLVDQLKGMSKGKTDVVSKLFTAMGDVGAVKYQIHGC